MSERLVLYETPWCPFCVRVRRVIDELGLEVEARDIDRVPEHRAALQAARGRTTVPVLRRVMADGADIWLGESADIIRYLRASYGPTSAG